MDNKTQWKISHPECKDTFEQLDAISKDLTAALDLLEKVYKQRAFTNEDLSTIDSMLTIYKPKP